MDGHAAQNGIIRGMAEVLDMRMPDEACLYIIGCDDLFKSRKIFRRALLKLCQSMIHRHMLCPPVGHHEN